MTRKDYEKIAEILKYNFECPAVSDSAYPESAYKMALKDVARGLCDIMKYDNPRFDAEKFRKACGF